MADNTTDYVEIGTRYNASISAKQLTGEVNQLANGELYYKGDPGSEHLYVKFSDEVQLAEKADVDANLDTKVSKNDMKTIGHNNESLFSSSGGHIDWPTATLNHIGCIKPGLNCEVTPSGVLNVKPILQTLDDMCNDGTYTYNFTYRELFEDKSKGYNVLNSEVDDFPQVSQVQGSNANQKVTDHYFTKPTSFLISRTGSGDKTVDNHLGMPLEGFSFDEWPEGNPTNERIYWWGYKSNFTGIPEQYYPAGSQQPEYDFVTRLEYDPNDTKEGSVPRVNYYINEVSNINVWETRSRFVNHFEFNKGRKLTKGCCIRYINDGNDKHVMYLDNFVLNKIPSEIAKAYCSKYYKENDSTKTPVYFWEKAKNDGGADIYVVSIKDGSKKKMLTLRNDVKKAMTKLYDNYLQIKNSTLIMGNYPIDGATNLYDLKDGLYYCHPSYNSALNVGAIKDSNNDPHQVTLTNGLVQVIKREPATENDTATTFDWSFSGDCSYQVNSSQSIPKYLALMTGQSVYSKPASGPATFSLNTCKTPSLDDVDFSQEGQQ